MDVHSLRGIHSITHPSSQHFAPSACGATSSFDGIFKDRVLKNTNFFFGRFPYVDELFHYRNIGKVIMPHSVLLIGSDWSLLEGGFPFLFRGRSLFLDLTSLCTTGQPCLYLVTSWLVFWSFYRVDVSVHNPLQRWLYLLTYYIAGDPGYRYSGCRLESNSLDKRLWSWCCYRGKRFKIMAEPNFRHVPSHTGWAVEPHFFLWPNIQTAWIALIGSLTRRENRIKWSQLNS